MSFEELLTFIDLWGDVVAGAMGGEAWAEAARWKSRETSDQGKQWTSAAGDQTLLGWQLDGEIWRF